MIVSKWSPDTEGEDQKEEAIPMWVHLENVPLHMYSWEGLSFITSTVGFPVKPHPETTACTNLNEAKIFVRVDVSKTLPKEITLSKDGKQFTVKFYYPWLPARCKVCDKWGHSEEVCGMKSKRKKSRAETGPPAAKTHGEKVASPGSVIKEKDEMQRVVSKVGSSDNKWLASGGSGQRTENGGGTSGWSMVSPAKTRRSLNLPAQKVDDIEISASKYSVLSTETTEEGEILEDDEKEHTVGDTDNIDPEELEVFESDHVEDIDQQVLKEKKLGLRRGRKAKALDANPGKNSRPRRKH